MGGLSPRPDCSFLTCFQLYGRRAPWEDPAKWVMDTYPWAASPQQHEWPPLLQLRPEDVGFDGYALPREGSTSKQVPPSDAEGDPLVSPHFLGSSVPRLSLCVGHVVGTPERLGSLSPALSWKAGSTPRLRPCVPIFSPVVLVFHQSHDTP